MSTKITKKRRSIIAVNVTKWTRSINQLLDKAFIELKYDF